MHAILLTCELGFVKDSISFIKALVIKRGDRLPISRIASTEHMLTSCDESLSCDVTAKRNELKSESMKIWKIMENFKWITKKSSKKKYLYIYLSKHE